MRSSLLLQGACITIALSQVSGEMICCCACPPPEQGRAAAARAAPRSSSWHARAGACRARTPAICPAPSACIPMLPYFQDHPCATVLTTARPSSPHPLPTPNTTGQVHPGPEAAPRRQAGRVPGAHLRQHRRLPVSISLSADQHALARVGCLPLRACPTSLHAIPPGPALLLLAVPN